MNPAFGKLQYDDDPADVRGPAGRQRQARGARVREFGDEYSYWSITPVLVRAKTPIHQRYVASIVVDQILAQNP